MSFLQDFKEYAKPAPIGVRLPNIEIEQKYYDNLGVDSGVSNYEFLRQLCLNAVKEKGIDKLPNKKEYYERTKMELEILNELGFVDYILLTWDVLNFCKESGIPTGPGRGSAAGSLVLFLVDITKIDPIKYDLFFERFISKNRAKPKGVEDGVTFFDGGLLPDVDNDIDFLRRQEVIHYIEDKHKGKTCKILTLNTLSGKLCIKECGKIVGEYSEEDVNHVSDMIPKQYGKVKPLAEAIDESEKFGEWAENNPEVFKIARKLENLHKNTGVHPSGIAISYQNLEDIMPLQSTPDGDLVSGYDMNWVAELAVKFDILGLRTLSVIHDVCDQLNIDPNDIDLDDAKMYNPLQDLNCAQGLFQIEAETNSKVCKKVKPRNLEEVSAVVAIARPGALDYMSDYANYVETGEFQSVHELFDEVLSYTAGIPLYQEQLMKMAVKIGFTLDDAEMLRRIVGKKKVDQMPAWKQKIADKIKENNLDPKVGEVLWKVAEDSANYSFNKSHSISYATLAAWTAYLKFQHPQEFFLSLLKMANHEPDPREEIGKISQELAHFGIRLLSPDLAKSDMDFKIEGKNIRFGLNSIKGVSEKSLQALQEFRDSDMPTKIDIFLAAKQAGINIGVLSSLIQAGALSGYKTNRPLLVLEAQAFNLLTDREKRNIVNVAEEYDYKILNIIDRCVKEKIIGDDKRPIIKESRFETFKKKFEKYRVIYDKNRRYEKFANWYFESELLGYSCSVRLKDVFEDEDGTFNDSLYYNTCDKGTRAKFIGRVEEVTKRKSQKNDAPYLRLRLGDEVGSMTAMLIDQRNKKKCTDYFENGGEMPKKGSVVCFYGSKSDDIVFMDSLKIVDQKIYMKLRDVK